MKCEMFNWKMNMTVLVFGLSLFWVNSCSIVKPNDHALRHDLRMIILCFSGWTSDNLYKKSHEQYHKFAYMISDLKILQKISQCGLRLLDSTVAHRLNMKSRIYWNSPTENAQLFSVYRTWVSSFSCAEALSQYSLHWTQVVPRGTSM